MTRREYVHLFDDDGRLRSFGPGETLPGWAVDRATPTDTDSTRDATDGSDADGDADTGDDKTEPDEPETIAAEPPRSGAGSSTDAWRRFLDYLGIAYPSNAGRDDLIDLYDAT